MSGNEILALGLLLVGGFLVGGVVSFGRQRKWIAAVVLAVLAALAVAAGVLRLIPT
ncbi:hypothetical protein LQ327_30760 [Actinomycetospora endophytica]|uniref:Secreted protein with PEP-CTERM sorting signal n=1 Tax=Actinomycetospora endophytica TaxID=2291215 RepID=A0ABS8PHK4_9PSEU|nr:hypothetical protein [Actinomycetospora endophytica]MCD2197761.1 hypothetical protein [Actinomycetospora endophytica]